MKSKIGSFIINILCLGATALVIYIFIIVILTPVKHSGKCPLCGYGSKDNLCMIDLNSGTVNSIAFDEDAHGSMRMGFVCDGVSYFSFPDDGYATIDIDGSITRPKAEAFCGDCASRLKALDTQRPYILADIRNVENVCLFTLEDAEEGIHIVDYDIDLSGNVILVRWSTM